MKMNKKGFTLIEMLVVIAIIAILVAIIVPTVTSATVKASAATNAANLRSFKAELAVDYLDDNTINGTYTAPTAKKCSTFHTTEDTAKYNIDASGNITVGYGTHGIDYFAKLAENGKTAGTALDPAPATEKTAPAAGGQ